jgi:hypothetical protein
MARTNKQGNPRSSRQDICHHQGKTTLPTAQLVQRAHPHLYRIQGNGYRGRQGDIAIDLWSR